MPDVLDRFPPAPALPAAPPVPGEVHVWRVPLDPPPDAVTALRALLSPDETARADRFHFDRHRRRYAVGRGVLRRLLGGYLRRPPETLRFEYGEREKPRLAGPGAAPGLAPTLEFNLSNSEELALIAITTGVEVGVDLEALRPMEDALSISERFFSALERTALAACPPTERDAAFFRCWTRKEAYVKAVGDGIALGLDRFDVSLDPGAAARFLALEGDPHRAAAWTLTHIEPAPGYVGALAIPTHPQTLKGFHWSP
jgi:4'-phosphopantetheinyl transferase